MQTTIIIPCYNEASRLKKEEFIRFASEHPQIDFLFVNDGSSDNTLEVLKTLAIAHSQLKYLDVQPNGGKAEAVRKGMLYAAQNHSYDYIGFWDADLATPLYEISNFTREMQRENYNVVTGLRLMRLGAKVHRKNLRHFLGRCFATVASTMLKLPVYDTQCGAKLYKQNIVEDLFSQPFITKWLFDVELLARYAKLYGHDAAKENIYEYPLLQWEDIGGSQLKFKDFFKAPYELIKINKIYKLK